MTVPRINRMTIQADETGTIELVCERSASSECAPSVQSFEGEDYFGILVDDLDPHERVTLFFDTETGPDISTE